jgi:lysozyme family protein
VDALDDQASVVIRLSSVSTVSISGGTVAAAGTGRVDNFTAMMTPVPEAGTAAMLAAGLAVVGFVARRRRA